MNRNTRNALIILSPFIILILFIAIILIINVYGSVASGVTAEGIKRIELEMKKEDVLSILGKPLETKADAIGHAFKITYAKRWFFGGADFWIYLNSDNRVRAVYVTDWDTCIVYSLYQQMDTGEIRYYINEELLYKHFR